MLLVLAIGAGLWGLGSLVGASRKARWTLIIGLYILVVLIQIALPQGNALRELTGGTAAFWLILGGAIVVGMSYSMGLGALRKRVQGDVTPERPKSDVMGEVELERYARHIVLREIGGAGQMRLRRARVLVVGAGGLGAPALQYLAATGVGTIGVIDDDTVENANLQRQVIHRDDTIGMPKVFSAEAAMRALNPYVTVLPYHRRLDAGIAADLMGEYDLVLDGSDSFETRQLVNAVAVAQGKPLISGALSQWEGQISVFDPAVEGPCYACVFPVEPEAGLAPSCAEAGVLGPLPGVIGAMMAVEAVKLIAGAGAPLRGQMLIYDALWGETRKIAVKRRADCAVCGAGGG